MTDAAVLNRTRQELWAEVKQRRNAGEADQAIALLEQLCAVQPNDPRFLLCMAELLMQQGRLDGAAGFLERARSVGSSDAQQLELLERLELRRTFLSLEAKGDHAGLISAYHQVVREKPDAVRRTEEWIPLVNRAGEAIWRQNGERVGAEALSVIREVLTDGITVRSLAGVTGDRDLLGELQAVVRATSDWTVPGKPHFFKAIKEEEAQPGHAILRAGLHPRLLEIANGFYGLYTRLVSANIVQTRTDASAERQRQGSEGWHRDPEDTPMFKIFIYLNDVTELGHGPFQYVPESRPGRKYVALMPRFGRGRYDPSYKTKPDPDQADREIAPEDIVTMYGPAGTMFFCDTSGFHRGGYCTSKDRHMTTLVYQRPGSQYPSYIRCKAPDGASLAQRLAVTPL